MSRKPWISGLLYPQMKVDRATAHYQEIRAQLRRFQENAYSVAAQDDPERGLQILLVKLNPMDRSVPILIGEYAYELRSGLDNLAWQLGLLGGRNPSRSSCFPIHASDGIKDRERFTRSTWDIPCEAVEIIKTFQPYQRGTSMKLDPLWQLNRLCNLDKHQTVGYSCTELRFTFLLYDGVPNPETVIHHEEDGITEVQIPLAHKGKVKLKLEPPGQMFGKPIDAPGPSFELTENQIAELHRYVRDEVLPPFGKFFPMGSSIWPPILDGKPAVE